MLVRSMIGMFAIAGSSLTLTGCLVMTGRDIDECGTKITSSTLNQIRPGETTEAWLIATLGEPTERTRVEGNQSVEVLRYDYVVSKSEGGTVFLIYAGGSESTSRTRTYFEVQEGIVTRYWTEA